MHNPNANDSFRGRKTQAKFAVSSDARCAHYGRFQFATTISFEKLFGISFQY